MSQPDTFTKFFRGPAELLRRAAKDIEAMCQESLTTQNNYINVNSSHQDNRHHVHR